MLVPRRAIPKSERWLRKKKVVPDAERPRIGLYNKLPAFVLPKTNFSLFKRDK